MTCLAQGCGDGIALDITAADTLYPEIDQLHLRWNQDQDCSDWPPRDFKGDLASIEPLRKHLDGLRERFEMALLALPEVPRRASDDSMRSAARRAYDRASRQWQLVAMYAHAVSSIHAWHTGERIDEGFLGSIYSTEPFRKYARLQTWVRHQAASYRKGQANYDKTPERRQAQAVRKQKRREEPAVRAHEAALARARYRARTESQARPGKEMAA